MRKAVLSISGNVYKQQEMEKFSYISSLFTFQISKVKHVGTMKTFDTWTLHWPMFTNIS
jgi:hypothetical protein